ncbi:hypothetical protein FS837_010212 [Tulasnella sp. UAMH 9824]|nr:hypothetical protein FS837_010212 [Tulasnella sp. UAMH 9824]
MIKEYSRDDGWMTEVMEPPYDRGEPPMKKPCSGLGILPLTSPNKTSRTLQEEPGTDDDYEILDNKKRKPRKSPTSTGKGKGKAKAQLHTLFDRLPTDIIYMNKPHAALAFDVTRIALHARGWAFIMLTGITAFVCVQDVTMPESFGSKARKAFPDIPDVKMLLDLLPHSNGGSSRTGKYYRMTDIEEIGAEWATVRQGSEAKIQEFKNRRKHEAEDIVAHGILCKTWDRNRIILKDKQRNEVKEARRNELFSRLEALGHHPEDVRDWRVSNHGAFSTSAALTEKRWESIRPTLESVVEDVKTWRLKRERSQIIDQRQALAENLLKNYQAPSDVPPAFQTPFEEFQFWPSFSSIVHQPNEVSVTASDFQPALDELPDLLAQAASEIQADLLRRMINGGATDINPSSLGPNFDKIRLATSLFWCRSSYNGLPVCGIDNLASHRCRESSTSVRKYKCLFYDYRASNLVKTLLATANMDPSTTAEQMDGMDLRFHCPGWANQPGRLAMGWRDAVRTYRLARWFSQVEALHQLQSGPWEVFSAKETALIKEKEMGNIEDERFRFRCNTCAGAVWIRRRELENHLEGWHSIVAHPNPTAEFHLHPRRPPQPITFSLSENTET